MCRWRGRRDLQDYLNGKTTIKRLPHQLRSVAKIPHMGKRLIGVPFRCILFICGAVTVLLGNLHRSILFLRPLVSGNSMPISWYLLPVALIAVGGSAIVIALLPSSWVAGKNTRPEPVPFRFGSVPAKAFGGFALFFYLLTVGLDLAPTSYPSRPWCLSMSACGFIRIRLIHRYNGLLPLAPLSGSWRFHLLEKVQGPPGRILLAYLSRFASWHVSQAQSRARFLIQIGEPINPNASRI